MELKVKIKHLSAYKNDGVYIIDQIKGLRQALLIWFGFKKVPAFG